MEEESRRKEVYKPFEEWGESVRFQRFGRRLQEEGKKKNMLSNPRAGKKVSFQN